MYDRCVYQTMEMIQDACVKISKVTLRDLFATNALNGMLANGEFHGSEQAYAEQAYRFADAMLEARRKK